jgi:prepilin-type processing-associated H-X9-DG protein
MVPDDASTYSELHMDRMLGRAPETAALGEAFAQMRSPELFRRLMMDFMEEEDETEELAAVLELLRAADDAVGPRLGWATWIPDVQSMMSGMMGGGASAATKMLPKVLVVAEVRDARLLDELLAGIAEELGVETRVEARAGGRTMTFAEGMVELVRGDDWMALGFPPESARKAADLAVGDGAESLYAQPGYLEVVRRMPVDAMLHEYVSASSVKQLLAVVNMFVPEAGFSSPIEEPLGMAMGVRVEDVQGRKVATAYYTADLATIPYLLDAPLTLQVVLARPFLEQEREEARQEECASQMAVIAEALEAYAEDHDGRLPKAESWTEAVWPYLDDEKMLWCPSDDSGAETSYILNEAASGLLLDETEAPESVVLLYESARHVGSANYLFADGQVEWLEEAPDLGVE